jgi:hypothetical protein
MTYLLRISGFAFLISRPLAKGFFNLTKVSMMARDGISVECKKRGKGRKIRWMEREGNVWEIISEMSGKNVW